MRRVLIFTTLLLAVPGLALAHVTVRPRESKPAAEEKYTVRVPTEGKVATTSVELQVPEGVSITEVPDAPGATHQETREGDRVVAITWTKEIRPGEVAEFAFGAKNPPTGTQITWKIQQRYAEGKPSDWMPVTKLLEAVVAGERGGQIAR